MVISNMASGLSNGVGKFLSPCNSAVLNAKGTNRCYLPR